MDGTLQQLAQDHSAAGDALAALVSEVEAATTAAYDLRREQIDAAVKRLTETRDRLTEAVRANADRFRSPRSQRCAGVEFGMAKVADKPVTQADTAALIREHYPELAPRLLRETVARGELKTLPAGVRRRIHVQIVRGEDAPFVRRVRDNLDQAWARLAGVVRLGVQ